MELIESYMIGPVVKGMQLYYGLNVIVNYEVVCGAVTHGGVIYPCRDHSSLLLYRGNDTFEFIHLSLIYEIVVLDEWN